MAAAAALAGTVMAQSAGQEPEAGLPTNGGVTYIDAGHPVTATGTLHLWRTYSSSGARAMLKVFRPEGDRLVLVGTSPLETVAGAQVVTFVCKIPVARNDVIGCFCPDATCIDRFSDGTALTFAGDAGTLPLDEFVTEVGVPAMLAAAANSAEIPSSASTDLVLPVGARTPGLNDTLWRTTLEIFNTAFEAADVVLYLNLSNEDNTTPAASGRLEVPARATLGLEDLFAEVFQLEEGIGSVDILASVPVLAHARIANYGGDAGSYGQHVPAVPARWALGDDDAPGLNPNGDIVYLFDARENEEWRTNLGLVNVTGVPLTLRVTAYSGSTQVGQARQYALFPYSHTQVLHILDDLQVEGSAGGIRLNVAAVAGSAGRFFAYASRVDNASGDAVFVPGDKEPSLD
jgi:hypothetical protein